MAPEQLEGGVSDVRSDIFAFGAMLYEMASGLRAFEAGSQAGVIAAILHPPTPLPSESLDRLVRICLAKDPDQRWQSAAHVGHALRWIEFVKSSNQPSRPERRWDRAVWAIASLALAASAVSATIWIRQPPDTPVLQTISYAGGDDRPAVSPDGKNIAFSSERGGKARIWLKLEKR
jgi:serine/threonine protein kinase